MVWPKGQAIFAVTAYDDGQHQDEPTSPTGAHNGRVPHLCDTIVIDAAACRARLGDDTLDDTERLMLLVVLRHGGGSMTFAELKHAMIGAVLDAGGVKAAIRAGS
jgi:hypothetical protein